MGHKVIGIGVPGFRGGRKKTGRGGGTQSEFGIPQGNAQLFRLFTPTYKYLPFNQKGKSSPD